MAMTGFWASDWLLGLSVIFSSGKMPASLYAGKTLVIGAKAASLRSSQVTPVSAAMVQFSAWLTGHPAFFRNLFP